MAPRVPVLANLLFRKKALSRPLFPLRKRFPRKRTLVGIVVLCLLLTSPAYAYDVVLTPEAREIALKLQCPVCEGESIAESNADVAHNMRVKLQEMMDAKRSEEEILDFFVERYGVFILRDPPKEGFALGVWVMPPLALLAGLGLLYAVFRSWRRQGSGADDEEEAPEAYEAQVEQEVHRWEGGA